MQTIPLGRANAWIPGAPVAVDASVARGLLDGDLPYLEGRAPDFVFSGPEGAAWWGWGEARRAESDGPSRFEVLAGVWAGWQRSGVQVAFAVCTFEEERPHGVTWAGIPAGALIAPAVALRRTSAGVCSMVVQQHGALPSAGAWSFAPPPPLPRCHRADVRQDEAFARTVASAVEVLQGGAIDKVVLARSVEHQLEAVPDPGALLRAMRGAQPDAWTLQVQIGPTTRFHAATPELLLAARSGIWETMALAGSRAIGADCAADAERLRVDPKERAEHGYVVEGITASLRRLRVEALEIDPPTVRRLPHLLHLQTAIRAKSPTGVGALRGAGELHPTPAVGGTPWPRAASTIAALESSPRGLYAGVIGVLDGDDALLVVALRSALQEGKRWTTFGGAGIVAASDPAREVRETGQKMRAMLEIFP